MIRLTKCKAIKADGTPCKAQAMHDSEYCFFHSPKVGNKRSTLSIDLGRAVIAQKSGYSYERLFGKGIREMPRKDKLREYEKFYDEGGIIARAIDSYVHVAIANGYQIIDTETGERDTPNTRIVKELDERINFHACFEKMFRSTLIYGFVWGEQEVDANKIKRLIFLPPYELEIDRVKTGKNVGIIKSLTQKRGKDVAQWRGKELKNTFFIPINVKHSELFGRGLIERIYTQAEERKTQGKNLDAVTKFIAYPFRVVKVGTDEFPASEDSVTKVADAVEKLNPGDWFATRHNITFEFHSPRTPEALTEVYKEKTRQLIVALGVPSLYTALEDIDAQTLKEIRSIFNSTVRSLQTTVGTEFENQIIKRQFELLGKLKKRTDRCPVKVVWNPLTVSVLSILELTQLVQAGVVGIGEARRIIESMGYGMLKGEGKEIQAPPIKKRRPKESHPSEEKPETPPIKPPVQEPDVPPTKKPSTQPIIKRRQPNEPQLNFKEWLEGIKVLKEIDKHRAWMILSDTLKAGFNQDKKSNGDDIDADT